MNFRIVALLIGACAALFSAGAQTIQPHISGTVLDPSGRQVAQAHIEFDTGTGQRIAFTTSLGGAFETSLPALGEYTVRVEAAGFAPIAHSIRLSAESATLTLRLEKLSSASEQVIVAADVSDVALTSPDPSEKVMVREELLDANPGRPGAPVSLPGLPIETASGGIKAPQYFVPGVAGDHGEPIAQYIAVGGYLATNNLSANAHGNGYADPNIYVSGALSGVRTDGGAFNVLEGNHALNLAATYTLRPQLKQFLTFTGDARDADLTAGFAPSDAAKKEWLALEANVGNGLMKRLEHRKQFKLNALRIFDPGKHEITLFGIGYFGVSHEGNLVPLGFGLQLDDTVDPRQKDQTHTSILAADDQWKIGAMDTASFSGLLRTYNLALFSNFGEGLIRQSEFRTVEGAEARETHAFSPKFEAVAGLDFNENDIHRDDLDHYLSDNPAVYGPFLKVLANNIDIRDLAPYAALHGDPGRHLRFYAGLRPEIVEMKNTDVIMPAHSFDEWKTFLSPKATLAWTPGDSAARWLPSAALSLGQAFFTQDPRISEASSSATGPSALPSHFERSHSEQLSFEKAFISTDVRLTLGRTTTTATMARIDPDNGSAEDLGPGMLKFLTASVRHAFSNFGTLQAVFSKADARLIGTASTPATITPEAPRTIFDALATLDRLPWNLHGRSEYEYVGHKLLDAGNAQHHAQFEAIPLGETRMALVRNFLSGRLELAANGMVARGYSGQTTETFDPAWQVGGPLPYCAPGSGPSALLNDFDCGTVERSVGIRMVSWVGGSVSWRFSPEK